MGRHRTIDREKVLDAAEHVVARDGAANLSLDAVASEAKISKASVLYDYKTKKALIRALVERRVAIEEDALRTAIEAQAGGANATIRGHIAASTRAFSEEERAVGLNLCAALAQDEEVREPVAQSIQSLIADIRANSTNPQGAMLAFLATEGLVLLEWFGFHRFSGTERDELIAQIGALVERAPASLPTSPDTVPGK